ncbi:hypothetical protein [Streptomyces sp. SID4917]|uniref:hypothetical protein n=1 Tax=Streptomyces sp. SID4917 TaxID=2690269 RepID=UPI001926664F|nr:hypothetical protein [Streptomyces sp. SID4917]MYZ41207.1 hypothetical protein [Streptomyces sp. SID4917]
MTTLTPVQFRSTHGDPVTWTSADLDSYEVFADIDKLPPLYVRYMQAAKASTTHRDACTACQGSQPCPVGGPVHRRFERLQDEYVGQQKKDG